MPELSRTFDRVVVLNLSRRSDRFQRFSRRLADWPFQPPQRFDAVDGRAIPLPPQWQHGAGAWGCMLSHRQVMRSAIADRVCSLLILEDDAVPVENFVQGAINFLAAVPADWDCIMLGGEHLLPPTPIAPAVVRCALTNRTHAFAVRGRMMPTLLAFWEGTQNDHCDIVLASLMPHFNVYAPEPFLIGQDAGYSDVTDSTEDLRFYATKLETTVAAGHFRGRTKGRVTKAAMIPQKSEAVA